MAGLLLALMIAFMVLDFLSEQGLAYLNDKSSKKPLTPELQGIYSESEHAKSVAYGGAKFRFALVGSTFSLLVIVLALTLHWFATLDNFVRGLVTNEIQISLIFIALASLLNSTLSLPFSVYGTFRLEEKFGFNRTTPKTFVLDRVKGTLVGAAIGGVLLTAILWIYQELQGLFWIVTWGLISVFSILMFMFGTSVLLPLFNKVTPLEDGELKTEIEKYCASQGYSLRRLFVMDGSKRSSKANAFFSGLGKSKTIVLFDTLIEKLNTQEVVAVLAHEVGHYKRKHTLTFLIFSNVQTFILISLLGALLGYKELATALGSEVQSFHISALAFFLLFTPISTLLGFLSNYLTRRNEYDADLFSKNTYEVEPMKSALQKISTDSLANLSPHPWYVAANYSHPTLTQRLANIDAH